jgi:glycosyltransferase involved in cell wall biosynthesis
MKLSIVIICWNDAECLGACLDSIYAAKLPFQFEVLVSDNGSSDGSREIAERNPAAPGRVRVLANATNLGFGPGQQRRSGSCAGRVPSLP